MKRWGRAPLGWASGDRILKQLGCTINWHHYSSNVFEVQVFSFILTSDFGRFLVCFDSTDFPRII